MTPRDRRAGASPEVEFAIIESDVHHLREQTDRDRRGFAERMNETRMRCERIEAAQATQGAQLARASDSLDRLEVARKADAMTLTQLVAIADRGRGALWVVGGLASFAGVGTIIEIVRLFLGSR